MIDQIISLIETKPDNWQKSAEFSLNKLAAYIPAEVQDESVSFKRVPDLYVQLSSAFASERGNINLVSSMAMVSRRMADRFENDETSTYGLKAIDSKLMPAIATGIVEDTKSLQNRSFVMNSYRVMAIMARNPTTHSNAVNVSNTTGLLPKSFVMMRESSRDPDVLARILEYHAAISSTNEGIQALKSSHTKTVMSITLYIRNCVTVYGAQTECVLLYIKHKNFNIINIYISLFLSCVSSPSEILLLVKC